MYAKQILRLIPVFACVLLLPYPASVSSASAPDIPPGSYEEGAPSGAEGHTDGHMEDTESGHLTGDAPPMKSRQWTCCRKMDPRKADRQMAGYRKMDRQTADCQMTGCQETNQQEMNRWKAITHRKALWQSPSWTRSRKSRCSLKKTFPAIPSRKVCSC